MTVNPKLKKTFESIMENDIETARSLFHDVVVEMSKEIYRTLESEDSTFDFDFEEEGGDDLLDPDFDDEEFDITQMTRGLGEDGDVEDLEFELETEPAAGDLEANDIDAGENFDEVEGEESLEDRIEDIEDAFEALKREFETIVGGDVDAESEEEAEDVAISDLDSEAGEEVADVDVVNHA